MVRIQTALGNILLELYPGFAPVTTANFLRYVDENRFAGASFYRTVCTDNQPGNQFKIEVIQGGLLIEDHPSALPPIPHETTDQTGILHKNGVLSMARDTPGTASSEFFICIGDQPELDFGGRRNPDGQGFAAFGMVILGMDVVKHIQNQPAKKQTLTPEIKILAVERA
jgi:peptidyl-prolyl cis-trans isomerase A (cyclophilin A)